uniref:Translation initiation factor IF-3 n=2 Tax=Porphyridium purpureum TaxID=35688 RepID=W0S1V7_PORPP|nr:translation initiation factor 3 [Porphyridium purpureum]ATJ02915.1 translation initiation factor 3 [Porphyridium purpureum]BAO23693.1 translation initiation factor 3 [Porphyridium purpureum]
MRQELPRINERIAKSSSDLVRVIDNRGEQLGLLTLKAAIEEAQKVNLDLVLINEKSEVPVCKIVNYSKYKFDQDKKAKDLKKKQQNTSLKEVKMRYKIEEHDYQVKQNQTIRFISSGHKVKVTINFRGREIQHTNLAMVLLNRLANDVKDIAEIQQNPSQEGRNMIMMLVPKKK